MLICILWLRTKVIKTQQQAVQQHLQLQQGIEQLQLRLLTAEKLSTASQKKVAELKSSQLSNEQAIEQVLQLQSHIEPKLKDLYQHQQAHANALQLIQSESKEQKLYGRAKKMIEMGADVEELINECEVPRAEAELLISLYRK
ncbi:MAG: DUF2802 domain-containing protein [Gammaproteobacteria bacterium]|nr:DUF2802 domain-containing protein [Gammaproteobacteria bacterium]